MCINYYDYTAYFKTFGENQKFEAIIGPQHKPLQLYKGNSEKYKGQAGAELCQAQFQFGQVKNIDE